MKLLVCLVVFVSMVTASVQAVDIVNDSWADGNRANTGALQADWWSSVGSNNSSVEVSSGSLGLVTGTAGRGLHGTFAPQTLAIGDVLTATLTFLTPATVGSETGGGGFRFGLADFNNAGLAADLQSSTSFPQPLYTNLPAYMVDFDVNRTGTSDDTSIREHNASEPGGRFLGSTTGWTSLGTSTDIDYTFTPNTEYVVVISLTRTGAGSMDIFGSLTRSNVVLTSHTVSDASATVNNIGVVAAFNNSNLFGSTNSFGLADNGIDFTNIRIEYIAIPEPSALALVMFGLAGLTVAKFRRRR